MWQSIWGVTTIIMNELWMTIIRMWEFIQLWFSSSERFLVQTWLEKYLPYVPEDFSESWRDGCLMAILLNKLRPGCFADANRLDPDYGLKNVYRVFDALEIYFGIKPNVSVEEIVTCIDETGSKLFEIFLELKKLTDNQPEYQFEPEPETENIEQTAVRAGCIAKGTGLTLGFVGKITSFIIYHTTASDLDIVVEIRGPNTICSERITKRSPKKKRSMCSWEYARSLTKSVSLNQDNDGLPAEEDDNFEKRIIPLEYEIISNQIQLKYKPKEKGKHRMTILWHGHHISDSPYIVTVEDPSEISGINKVMYFKSALKTTSECEKNKICDNPRKISVRFQDGVGNCKEQKKGKIVSRRVLRYIVKIRGKDVPVNAENPESLATELLKMDYDNEKCPSFHRRNSWGFTGDAERKKSVIRQFCIDVNELDAQISQRRSRSLSINPGTKSLMQKCDSFESLTSNLNIVNEVAFESHEKARDDERNYAYLNEDPVEVSQKDEVKHNDDDEAFPHTSIEKETSELSSELNEGKFAESLKTNLNSEVENDKISSLSKDMISNERVDNSDEEFSHTSMEKETSELSSELTFGKFAERLKKNLNSEIEAGKISSLSTVMIPNKRVDNSDEDLQSNISQNLLILEVDEPRVEKINRIPLNNQCSDMKLHHENEENKTEYGKNDSKTSESLQILNLNKATKKHSKLKNYARNKCSCSCSLKKYRIKRKNEKIPTFSYGKVSRNKNSTSLSPISTLIKPQGNDKHVLKLEGQMSSIFLESRLKDSVESKTSVFEYDKDEITEDAKDISTERLNMSQVVQNASNDENDTPSIKAQCIKNTEEKKLTEVIHSSKNIIYEAAKPKIIFEASKNHELKAKKVDLNHNANSAFLPPSKIETKDSIISGTEPLRTLTPRPVEQFVINNNGNANSAFSPHSKIETKDSNISETEPLRTFTPRPVEQFVINRNANANSAFSPHSKIETKDSNISETEPLRILTLRPVEQFVINHNANGNSAFLPHSKMETKDSNISEPEPLRTLPPKPMEQFVINHSLNVFPTESESGTKSDKKSKSLRTHSLKAIGEFDFKQFTPFFETQNSSSPVKLQIEHWESTLSPERQDVSLQKMYTSDTELVSVKDKLAFWENACETEQIPSWQNKLKNRKMDLTGNTKSRIFNEDNSDAERKDLHTVYSTSGHKSNTLVSIVKEQSENFNSINKETNLATEKQTDNKISAELQLASHKIKVRSFSDPVTLETAVDEQDILVNISALESTKNVYSSSSTDDNLGQYDDSDEDSGCDYILHSAEDEYIDDEISESASEYWGDLSIVKGWKVARCENECSYSFLEKEFLQSYQQNKSYPEECKVFGIAVYYGHVAIKNRFRVYTGDAGFGNLSVSMQGFRQYDVSLVTVAYVRNDIYEVTYQVMTAGYYLVLIRWMDKAIGGSPFVCKVTF